MRVIIIGAGFGGLCLANGLLQRHRSDDDDMNMDIQVFERHSGPDHDLAGYGLHVDGDGKKALRHCLDGDTYRRFLAASTPAGSKWAFRGTRDLGTIAVRDDSKISGKPEEEVERRAVHRFEFRDILLKGLRKQGDEAAIGVKVQVHWGKSFVRYEEISRADANANGNEFVNGSVRAYFQDGTSAEGDILVGADGSKSLVRQQRFPDLTREDLGIAIICGRYQLTPDRVKKLPDFMTDGSLNNIVPRGKGWLFLASFPHTEFENVRESYTLWAYVVPKGDVDMNTIKQMTPEKMRDLVLDGVKGWKSTELGLGRVIKDVDLTTISPIILKSMPVLPKDWNGSSKVVLLGDSIHNMTPMAGVGANVALRDAHLLTDTLVEVQNGKTNMTEAITKYEVEMKGYANAAVALSRQIAQGASSTSTVQRWAFHGLLRLAQACLLVMRHTIGRGALED
ncbi:hypothetical protein LTS17_008162 [Exophiala oligosperma]